MAIQITDQNFEEFKNCELPLVVDFWATWCGPCQMVLPIITDLAAEYDGRVNVGKCNVDENSEIPAQFGIRSIPTILFFKNGEVVSKLVGAQNKETIRNEIEALIS